MAPLFRSTIRGAASIAAAGFTTTGTAPTMSTAPTGGDAILIPYGNTTATRLIRKSIAQPTGVDYWIRVLVEIDGTPGASMDLFSIQNAGGTTWRCRIGTGRTVQLIDSVSGTLATSAALTINTIAVFDVYWRVVGTSTGLWEYHLNGTRISSGSTANLGTAAGTEWVCGKNVSTNSGINVYVLPEVGVNDGTGAADNSWLGIFTRSGSEAVAAAATASRSLAVARSTSEALTAADSSSRVTSRPRAATESTAVSVSASRSMTRSRSAAEGVAVSCSASRQLAWARAGAEACVPSTTAARSVIRSRVAAEATRALDTASVTVSLTRSAAETVRFSDAGARAMSLPRAGAEAVSTTMGDSVTFRGVQPPSDLPTTVRVGPSQATVTVGPRAAVVTLEFHRSSVAVGRHASEIELGSHTATALVAPSRQTAIVEKHRGTVRTDG